MSQVNVGDRVLVSVPGTPAYTGVVERIETVREFGGFSSSTATVVPEAGRVERDRADRGRQGSPRPAAKGSRRVDVPGDPARYRLLNVRTCTSASTPLTLVPLKRTTSARNGWA
jgi:hypothetical protein